MGRKFSEDMKMRPEDLRKRRITQKIWTLIKEKFTEDMVRKSSSLNNTPPFGLGPQIDDTIDRDLLFMQPDHHQLLIEPDYHNKSELEQK